MTRGGAAWLPVRNSSISVRIRSGSEIHGAWSLPSTSSNRAPGMWSARYRPHCTGTMSSRAWMTNVGTVMVGRIGRTSIRNRPLRVSLAPCRGWRSCAPPLRAGGSTATDGSRALTRLTAAPRRHGRRGEGLPAGELLHRGRVVLTQLRHEACPHLGRIAVQVVPVVDERSTRRTCR